MKSKQKTRKRPVKKVMGEALSALDVVPSRNCARPSLEPTSSTGLMEEILERNNMQMALKRVVSNKGCAGCDGLEVTDLPNLLKQRWPQIKLQLETGEYRPGIVKRVVIPKAAGGERKLGIPGVLDRLIQQAMQQVLSRILDPLFSDSSFGFRPKRSCHQAIELAKKHVSSGRNIVVDIDLAAFFDRVNHDRLMSRLSTKIKDKRVLRLIGSYLRAGVLEGGLVKSPSEGTPQGGPLSPLLSNVVLDELDKELERRGHRFARYADDCNIYVRSERSGKRVMSGVRRFIEKNLKLKVNEAKSAVARVDERQFLGFSFTSETKPRIKISSRAIKRFKDKVRDLTQRGQGLKKQIAVLSRYLQGWFAYYGKSELPSVIKSLDQWIRRRLRALRLKSWRKPGTRYRRFKKHGMSAKDCRFVIHTTKRFWYLSGTKAVSFALNLKYFRNLGLYSMYDRYELQSN